MIYGQLGRNDQVVEIGLFARIVPVVCNYYIQIYINLCLVISPSRAPPSLIYLCTHLEGPQTRLLSLLQDDMWRLLSAYKTKPVIIMIIKRNLKNKCIISIPAELGSVVHVLFVYFRKSEPVRIRYEIVGVNKFIFRSYINEVYT